MRGTHAALQFALCLRRVPLRPPFANNTWAFFACRLGPGTALPRKSTLAGTFFGVPSAYRHFPWPSAVAQFQRRSASPNTALANPPFPVQFRASAQLGRRTMRAGKRLERVRAWARKFIHMCRPGAAPRVAERARRHAVHHFLNARVHDHRVSWESFSTTSE